MKLVNLIKEMPSPDENNLIDDLKKILKIWDEKQYNSDEERWHEYHMDIEELIEDYEEEESMRGIAVDAPLKESLQKAKNKVRNTLKKLMQQ